MSVIILGFTDFPRVKFSTLNFGERQLLLGFLFCFWFWYFFFLFFSFLFRTPTKEALGTLVFNDFRKLHFKAIWAFVALITCFL